MAPQSLLVHSQSWEPGFRDTFLLKKKKSFLFVETSATNVTQQSRFVVPTASQLISRKRIKKTVPEMTDRLFSGVLIICFPYFCFSCVLHSKFRKKKTNVTRTSRFQHQKKSSYICCFLRTGVSDSHDSVLLFSSFEQEPHANQKEETILDYHFKHISHPSLVDPLLEEPARFSFAVHCTAISRGLEERHACDSNSVHCTASSCGPTWCFSTPIARLFILLRVLITCIMSCFFKHFSPTP